MTTNRVFGVATTMFYDEHYKRVIYHNTAVVSYNHDEIILNSGGWLTNTTKKRMNQVSDMFDLGYQVYQKDYTWYVDYKGWTYTFHDNMKLLRA